MLLVDIIVMCYFHY